MSSHANQDSNLQFVLGPADRAPPPGSELPVYDLSSQEDSLAGWGQGEQVPGQRSPGKDARPVPSGQEPSMWLDGDVLMCGCPDCRAPMSIRIWLMVADCWQCGTSIELSEEQEREAMRLLAEREQGEQRPKPEPKRPTKPGASPPARQTADGSKAGAARAPSAVRVQPPGESETAARRSEPQARGPVRPAERRSRPPGGQPSPRPTSPAPGPRRQPRRPGTPLIGARARVRKMATAGAVRVWLSDFFRDMPAWLVSLVFHLVVLTLLGLLTMPQDDDGPYITLSATVSKDVRQGGDVVELEPTSEADFDLPIPPEVDMQNEEVREAMVRADQDARELQVDPDTADPNLADLHQVKRQISSAGAHQALAARDPRVRVEVVKQEGGTTLTEAAVARGLRWLDKHQNADGSWSLHNFDHASGCTCGGSGAIRSDAGGTSLALLPFLGAGQTHLSGRYQETVARGLGWMIKHQKTDGDLRAGSSNNAGMYAHGQASIVLCEAFLMTGDEALRIPAQKAIDFIVNAQHAGGGWRYQPGQAGDTSVVGWQLMALQSARMANLTVPPSTLENTGHFLDSVQHQGGSQYAYMPGRGPTHVMTAEALLCRMYLGWNREQPGLTKGMQWLLENHLPQEQAPDIYYWYYATQAFHHLGGTEWEQWNRHMRDILVQTQQTRGHAAGSWDPRGPHASAGGRLYMTALAVCSLEVYYRHLPIFRQLELDE